MNEKNIHKNEELLYKEWVPAGKFVKVVILFVFLLILTIGIIFTTLMHKQLLLIGVLFGCVCLFILLVYWNFRGLKITLTKNQLEIVYGIFNHKRLTIQISEKL